MDRTSAGRSERRQRTLHRAGQLARSAVVVLRLCGALVCALVVGDAVARLAEPASAEARPDALLLQDPAVALRAAREAAGQGDLDRSLGLLAQVEAEHPIVADYAALLRLRGLVEAGRYEEAGRVAAAASRRHPDSRLQPRIDALRGDLLEGQGAEKGARQAWQAALDGSRDDDLSARLYTEIAHSLERSGRRAEAAETWEALWIAYPVSDAGREAGARLDRIEAGLDTPVRSASDWRRHADRLFRSRRNPEALAAYDRALASGLAAGSERRRAEKQRGHTLFRLRRYPEAVEAFSALPQTGDVPLWRARSMARAGRVPESIVAFEELAEKARGDLGMRATFLAALLLDGRNYTERAVALFERVAKGGRSGVTHAALWRLGWSAYREDKHEQAIRHFDRLISLQDPMGQLRTRYWRARSLEHLADPSAADEYASLARDYPLSYYGWRARARAQDDGQAPLRKLPDPGRDRISTDQLRRSRILLSAGLEDEARAELRSLAREARSLRDRLEVAQLLSDAGEYNKAQRLVVDPYNELLARGPVARLEELWWHAWPSAFRAQVDAATEEPGSVEPSLVFSIMREESGYRPAVMSASGARGLLQIMDETGARLAERAGLEDFDAEQLFEPATNIDLGSNYLAELMRRFPGRLSASIASYNAGPRAVASWVEAAPTQPDDEWVESIPYDQTRGYVKRVLRSIHAYEVLY